MEDHEFAPLDGETGEFEKRVQQKMKDISLAPSDTVWQKVDQRLHPANKRQRWFIWLFFLLAGLGLGGYLLWQTTGSSDIKKTSLILKNKQHTIQPETTHTKPDNKASSKATVSTQTRSESLPLPENMQPATATGLNLKYVKRSPGQLKKKQVIPRTSRPVTSGSTGSYVQSGASSDLSSPEGSSATRPGMINKEKNTLPAAGRHANPDREKSGVTGADTKASEPPTEITPFPTRNPEPKDVGSPFYPGRVINTSLGLKNIYPPAFATNTKLNKTNKLRWGFVMAGGRSTANEGKINSLFRSSSPAFDALSAAPAGNINLPPTPVGSALKAGPAFQIGMFADRRLSSRLSLSVGLNYNLYTLSYRVGQKIDSLMVISSSFASSQRMVNEYFKAGNSQKYINRYHFVELPVIMHAKLTAGNKMPVSLDLGLSLSQLVSSNALHYNASSGIYFKDNNLFKKTQLNLVTGLPIRILLANKFSIDAGPHIQYGITRLLSDKQTDSKHLFFLGVRAGILFGKK